MRRPIPAGRLGILAISLCVVGVGLAGCLSPDPVPAEGAGPSIAATASDLPLPVASASAPAKPTAVGTPTDLTCNDVLSPDDLYALKGGTNLSLSPGLKPESGSMASRLVTLKGISCAFVNDSSGEMFTVGVAKPTAASMPLVRETVKAEQGASYRVSAYSAVPNSVGYFRVYNGIGLASVVTSTYWFSVSSDTFETANDAKQIVLRIEKALAK